MGSSKYVLFNLYASSSSAVIYLPASKEKYCTCSLVVTCFSNSSRCFFTFARSSLPPSFSFAFSSLFLAFLALLRPLSDEPSLFPSLSEEEDELSESLDYELSALLASSSSFCFLLSSASIISWACLFTSSLALSTLFLPASPKHRSLDLSKLKQHR